MNARSLLAALSLAPLLVAPAAADDAATGPVPLRVSAPHALLPLVTAFAASYALTQAQPVVVSESSSSGAPQRLRAGETDVAIVDTAPGDSVFTDTRVAAVPFALIANPADGVSALDAAGVRAVFDRRALTWKDVGGADVRIATIERPRRSASEALLEQTFALTAGRAAADDVEDASGSVVADVRDRRGAIGVVALPFAGDLAGVRVVRVDGANVRFVAFEHAITFGAASLAVSRFVAFVRTQSGEWRDAGFVPMRDLANG